MTDANALSPEKLRPRIRHIRQISTMADDGCGTFEFPYIPIGDTPYSILLVLDYDDRVQFLDHGGLSALDLTLEAAFELALTNLDPDQTFASSVRNAGEKYRETQRGAFIRIMMMDSYDASRMLLIPRALEEGEEVLAVIPDTDTLGFSFVASGEDAESMREFAKVPLGDNLIAEHPFRIRKNSIEYMEPTEERLVISKEEAERLRG